MSFQESRPSSATVFRPRRADAQAAARPVTQSRFQAGGFGIGLVIGLLLALAAALIAALVITRTPAPFVDKVPSSSATDRLPMTDPNAGLSSASNSTKVVTPNQPAPEPAAPEPGAQLATGMDDAPAVPAPTVPSTATLPSTAQAPAAPAAPAAPPARVAALTPPAAVLPPAVDPAEAARKAKEAKDAADRKAKLAAERKAKAEALAAAKARDADAILNGGQASAPAPQAPAAQNQRTYVQAGAFSSREQADRQRAQLTLQGYVVQVQERQVNGNTIYRVRLGPFARRAQAEVAQAELQAMSVPSMVVGGGN
ncbi:SPOR domain-containing protein [Amphibiibacter pelophylacis]|uniref:SPOR domain-containing protein n=1 Tax=Amphibiibacter pelophylacis TaxID=1799477 RepID=A0ACC6P0K5_9BURK